MQMLFLVHLLWTIRRCARRNVVDESKMYVARRNVMDESKMWLVENYTAKRKKRHVNKTQNIIYEIIKDML